MTNQKWLSLNFFAFFFTWGIFLPYWTGWLTNAKGLSVVEASVIMGTGMIARAFSTLFFFPALTRLIPLGKLLKWLSFVSFAIVALYIPSESYVLLFVVTVGMNMVYPTILPATESGATVLMQTDNIHYGKSRLFGSVGYIIAVLLVGSATAIYQEQAILWMMLAALLFMAAVQSLRAPVPLQKNPDSSADSKVKPTGELLKSRAFLIVLLVSILLQGAHASYYNYGFLFLQDLNVSGMYIGMILNVAVLFEILFFAKADTLFAKWPASSMFLLAGIGSTVRWLLIFLFPSVWVFIFAQLLHAVSFGVAHFAFIRFIFQRLKPEHIPTAQGMYAALGMSLSVALLTFVGGYLYDISPGLAFLGMTIFSAPALLIILFTRKRLEY